jgi:site-specific DNA-methyltransferase (adenine-specific)
MSSLLHGDCLDILPTLDENSIDLLLVDLPYGTTQCRWDTIIPFEPLWQNLRRVCKPQAAMIFTASQPFTSNLVCSNIKEFKHEWIWIKNRGSNFANTVREPFKEHETVLVFAQKSGWTYNKQMQERTGGGASRVEYDVAFRSQSENYQDFEGREPKKMSKLRVPSSWQKFNTQVGLHPTQKPVDLMAYLVRTYSNQGDTVLDCCMGSGTTGVACEQEGRKFIGIEKDPQHFTTAVNRINNTKETLNV